MEAKNGRLMMKRCPSCGIMFRGKVCPNCSERPNGYLKLESPIKRKGI